MPTELSLHLRRDPGRCCILIRTGAKQDLQWKVHLQARTLSTLQFQG